MYYPMINHYNWGWNFGVTIFWLLFLIFIIVVIFRSLRRHAWDEHMHHDHPHAPVEKTDPLDIAKARYAKGDITKDEFDQIKKDLQ